MALTDEQWAMLEPLVEACRPLTRNEAPGACPEWIYNNRNRVERLWARLKEWCAVATRYEKPASSFLGTLCLAAALGSIRR